MKKYVVMFMFCLLTAISSSAFAATPHTNENIVKADGWLVKAIQTIENKETVLFSEYVNKTMGKKEVDGSVMYQSKHFNIIESATGETKFQLTDVNLNNNIKLNIKRVIYY